MYKIFFLMATLFFGLCDLNAADKPSGSISIQNFVIDKEHTNLNFEIAHLVISTVAGRFDDFEGKVEYDSTKKTIKKIEGTAQAKSINTNQEKRDKHLRSADFFDVDKFPKLEFLAENLNLKSGKKTEGKAYLTIHGIKKEVNVDFDFKGLAKDPWGTEKLVLNAVTEINRKDFGLEWNEALETGGVMVGEKLKIFVKAQANLNNK